MIKLIGGLDHRFGQIGIVQAADRDLPVRWIDRAPRYGLLQSPDRAGLKSTFPVSTEVGVPRRAAGVSLPVGEPKGPGRKDDQCLYTVYDRSEYELIKAQGLIVFETTDPCRKPLEDLASRS